MNDIVLITSRELLSLIVCISQSGVVT